MERKASVINKIYNDVSEKNETGKKYYTYAGRCLERGSHTLGSRLLNQP